MLKQPFLTLSLTNCISEYYDYFIATIFIDQEFYHIKLFFMNPKILLTMMYSRMVS